MKRTTLGALALFAASGLLTTGSVLADISLECNGCTSTQKRNLAYGSSNRTQQIYVLDFQYLDIAKYQLIVESDTGGGGTLKRIFERPLTAEESQEWDDIVDVLVATRGDKDIPGDGFGESAYGVIADANAINAIGNHYMSTLGFWRIGLVLPDVYTMATLNIVQFSGRVSVTFPDGSVIEFDIVEFGLLDGTIELEVHSAFDGDGNVIHTPENAGQYVGDRGTTTNPQALVEYWGLVSISWTRTGHDWPNQCTFACDNDGCTLTCGTP